ncbi:ABC transporter permease [Paraburkholderia sp. DHOC27]|uniref:ABC transporter permease n=1 Tax=Paraburkholderia sp. DHOC27 TaxID=2303330 RepID=UPI000E3C1DF7|nr:ABC transporter permease [Paraburkholderia sp. DHOC27]RFU44766.1 ABC transporter permease [Paraburkholderia sp. DHOC27]
MNRPSELRSPTASSVEPPATLSARLKGLRAPWAWSFVGAVGVAIVIAFVFGLAIAGNVVLTALVFGIFMVLVGLAQMLVITSGPGNIDLSVPSVIALAGMIGVHVMAADGVVAGFAAAIASGVLVGFANYLLIRVLRIPPIIATLSSSFIIQSVAITQSRGMNAPPVALETFANGHLLGLPHLAWIALVLSVAIAVLLHLTVFGRGLSAVGQNPRAAWLAGVGVERTRCKVYLLSGGIAALTGVLLAAVSGGATLDMGVEYMLISIAVVVIGGTQVTGGRATVLGVWGASMFLFLTNAVLNALGAGAGVRSIAYGLLIIVVVVASGGRSMRY